MFIAPIPHPLSASVRVPGSKSLTNRALLIAALARRQTRLTNALFSDDSLHFARALQALGFEVALDEAMHEMAVTGLNGKIPARKAELFAGNSGTTARFLCAFLALGYGEYVLDGEARMRERPVGDLVSALAQLGAHIEPALSEAERQPDDSSGIGLPLRIHAGGLRGGRARIGGEVSSQFLSALLMIAPYARQPVQVELSSRLNSRPYVDMTLAIMQDFGIQVARSREDGFVVQPGRYSSRRDYRIESDASAAAYFFAAPAICGGAVRVENISRNSRQGDIAFLEVLVQMGCRVQETGDCIQVSGAPALRGVEVDMRDIPDTAQTLAVIAPFAASPTRIRGIASARLKETDRIRATCAELSRLGVQVEEHEDGMTVHPCGSFTPALVRTYNDHRMAMAFSLVGLRVDNIAIENPGCVSKTFPNYFDVLESLR